MLRELREFKIPALRQAGFRLAGDLTTVLMSRSGYSDQVHKAAEADPGIILVDVAAALAGESTHA